MSKRWMNLLSPCIATSSMATDHHAIKWSLTSFPSRKNGTPLIASPWHDHRCPCHHDHFLPYKLQNNQLTGAIPKDFLLTNDGEGVEIGTRMGREWWWQLLQKARNYVQCKWSRSSCQITDCRERERFRSHFLSGILDRNGSELQWDQIAVSYGQLGPSINVIEYCLHKNIGFHQLWLIYVIFMGMVFHWMDPSPQRFLWCIRYAFCHCWNRSPRVNCRVGLVALADLRNCTCMIMSCGVRFPGRLNNCKTWKLFPWPRINWPECSQMPKDVSQRTLLKSLDIANNDLTGKIPAWMSTLTQLIQGRQ